MNGSKLSVVLLLTSIAFVHAEAPKKAPTKEAQQAPVKVSQKNYREGGKESARLFLAVVSNPDAESQKKFTDIQQEYVKPLVDAFQKEESVEAKKAWKDFQDFQRGFKEVFEKNPPKAPAEASALEKEAFALSMDMQKATYELIISSVDVASFNKAMQEKAQSFMAKQAELQKKFQAQMEANAKKAEAKPAAKNSAS